MRSVLQRSAVTIVSLLLIVPASADDVTARQLSEILEQLRQIRALLETERSRDQAIRRPHMMSVDVSNAPVLGDSAAPVTIVEFIDYECEYCRQFHRQTFGDLKERYVLSGRVKCVAKHFPLENHPNARLAAEAALCAAEQKQFWSVHEKMQATPERLTREVINAIVVKEGLDVNAFAACLNAGRYKESVTESVRDAASKGVQGTPAFVVGRSTNNVVEGELVMGAMPLGVFEEKIKRYSQ
jgi:protein-disulfide isomerase